MKIHWRIVSILVLAGLHTLVTYGLLLGSFPLVMDHFDSGEPFSWTEKLPIHATNVLLAPYYFVIFSAVGLLSYSPVFYGAVWVGNSLLWGFTLDWLIRGMRRWVRRRSSPNP